ncbi:MAG: hypothetical protein H6716_23430 [Polyangiaceae bacterium]|nr:hypothetical protein [Polyangiaceae bacterium]
MHGVPSDVFAGGVGEDDAVGKRDAGGEDDAAGVQLRGVRTLCGRTPTPESGSP